MHTIDLASKEDILALTVFFAKVYSPSHITTNKEYLSWQYQSAPGNIHAPKYSNIILKKEKEIIGHLGLIPYIFHTKEGKKKGAYLSSLIVHESLRSYGAGSLMVKEAEKYFDILYTTRANKMAIPSLKYNNWSDEFFMKRWVFDYVKKNSVSFLHDPNVISVESFDKEWDSVWEGSLKKKYDIIINRSSEYLNWRFCNILGASYSIFCYKEDSILGYIVLRIEKGNEFRACRVVDLVANEASMLPLLKKAVSYGHNQNVHFTDFFVYPNNFASDTLKEAGFYVYDPDVNPEPPMFILPTNRKKLTTNIFYKFVDNDNMNSLASSWYMTKADGDRDRPY